MNLLIVKCLRLNHLIIFLLVSFCVSVKALDPQKRITQYDIKIYTAKDGLPMNACNDIFQDSRGYIWIATQEGLVRWDGSDFKLFDKSKYSGITENFILDIEEDEEGNLWIATSGGGVCRFDGRRFHSYDLTQHQANNFVKKIAKGKNNVLWFGTENGLVRFQNNVFKTYNNSNGLRHNNISSVLETQSGEVLAGTWGGLYKIRADKLELITKKLLPFAFLERKNHEVILAGNRRKLFSYINGIFSEYRSIETPTSHLVLAMYEDEHENLWLCTEGNGILRYNNGKFESLKEDADVPDQKFFTSNMIRDRENNLWISSGSGVIKLFDNKFSVFGPPEGFKNSFGSTICEDFDGWKWAGIRQGGIVQFNADTTINWFVDSVPEPVDILSLLPDSNNGIWCGYRYEIAHFSSGKLRRYDISEMLGPSYSEVLSMTSRQNGNILIGVTRGSLLEFDRKEFKIKKIAEGESGNIICLLESKNQTIWIGTAKKGLYQLQNEKLINIDRTFGFSALGVNALYEDAEGTIWIATDEMGLYRYKKEIFSNISSRNGLAFDRLFSILEDDLGYLWFSGNRGVFRVEKAQLDAFFDGSQDAVVSQYYDHLDGMRKSEFNGRRQPVAWKSRDGRLWFVSIAGVVTVDPNNLLSNPIKPPVYIERVDTPHKKYDVFSDSAITLHADERELEFQYVALSYTIPERVLFQYQLEGYDNNWIDAGNRRSAFYTNLPRGEYTFRVKACNNDGVWNETGAAMTFTIPPFWFETWWAKSIFGILAMLALVLASRMYIRKNLDRQHMRLKAEQATRLEQLDRMKTRFFANISHEFRTPLTLILGPLEQFLAGKLPSSPENDYRIMHRNALRLQGLINQLLDLSKLDAGGLKLQAQPTEIGRMLKTLCQSFLSLAEQLGVQLHLDFPGTEQVVYLDREKFEKILTNILSNTFKFTPKGGVVQVRLRLHLPSDDDPGSDVSFVEIEIRDTGIGITQEQLPHIFDRFYQADAGQNRVQEGSGIGLALARELVELHHGDIRVASEPGKGTTFFIKLPTGKSHLQDEEIISENLPEVHDFQPAVRDIFAAEKVAASSTTHPVVSGSAPLVLIVEDNADLRYYLRSRLNDKYRIAEAENGQKGIAIAQESMPDLVISDVMMPETDGFELCRRLKTDERTSHIPVILLTALAAPENKLEGLENRADDYIVKPFDAGELRVRVRNLIENREMLRQRFRTESGIQPANVTVTRHDEVFLKKALSVVEKHLANQRFSLDDFAGEMAWSAKTLQRKIKALTGFTAHEFIYDIRLKTAAQLLRESDDTVTTIAIDTGFSSPGHLAKLFRKRFGMSPSVYRSVNTPT